MNVYDPLSAAPSALENGGTSQPALHCEEFGVCHSTLDRIDSVKNYNQKNDQGADNLHQGDHDLDLQVEAN